MQRKIKYSEDNDNGGEKGREMYLSRVECGTGGTTADTLAPPTKEEVISGRSRS